MAYTNSQAAKKAKVAKEESKVNQYIFLAFHLENLRLLN